MRVTILGKGAARGVSRIWETGQGHRFGKRAGWAGAGLCGLTGVGLALRCTRTGEHYSGIATCPAEDSATCRCWTALRPDRRPSRTAPGPHDSPGDSPSTSDCPTITALASVFRSPSLGMLCCRRWHNRTPSQPETRDKSVRAPRLFEAMFQCRKGDLAAGVVESCWIAQWSG